jgi:hypothetical protein
LQKSKDWYCSRRARQGEATQVLLEDASLSIKHRSMMPSSLLRQ